MGKQSIKKDKNIYQLLREDAGLTRESAASLMTGMTARRIEKIENGQEPTAFDVMEMAKAYNHPELSNIFCTRYCEIGKKYVPEITLLELPEIILETIAGLNSIMPMTNRLIEITRDGKITEDEAEDFALIKSKLKEIAAASDALNLWAEKNTEFNQKD